MKSPAFQWYAGDFLSSPDVRLMSLVERGAYITLLSTAWQSTPTGHLPADEKLLRRMAEMSPKEWEESSDIILKKFPLSECGTYRYNPRLMAEVEKQHAFRESRSKDGQASAAKRAEQQKGNKNSTRVEPNPTRVENQGNINPTLHLQSSSSISEEKKIERERAGEVENPVRAMAPELDTTPTESPNASASHTEGVRPYQAYNPDDYSPALVLPFATNDFRASWSKWRRYHAEELKRPLGGGMREQEALRKLSGLAGKSEPLAIAIVDQAISKGWKDLFPLDSSSPAFVNPVKPTSDASSPRHTRPVSATQQRHHVPVVTSYGTL